MTTQQEEVNRLLRDIIGRVRTDLARPSTQPAIAPYVQSPITQPQLPDTQKPSIASRIFDVLSRPVYGTAGFVKGAVESEQAGEGVLEQLGEGVSTAGRGLAGKEKNLFSDVLETMGMERGPARTALGFTGDVLLDPLTYAAGAGIFSKLGAGSRGVQKSLGGLREVQDATETATRDLVSRAANVNPQQVAEAQIAAGRKLRSSPEPPPLEPPVAPSVPRELQSVLPSTYEFPRVNLPGMQELRKTSATEALSSPTIAVPEALRGLPLEEALPKFLSSQQKAARRVPAAPETGKLLLDPVAEAGARETREVIAGRLTTKEMPPLEVSANSTNAAREVAQRFLKKNKHTNINEAGQEDLLRMISNHVNSTLANRGVKAVMSKTWEPVRYQSSMNMLRVAEQEIERAGRSFVAGGKPLKMSEVMNEVGVDKVFKEKRWRDALTSFATGRVDNLSNPGLAREAAKVLDNRARIQADVANKSMEAAIARGQEFWDNAIAARAKENARSLGEALGTLQKSAGLASTDIKTSKSFLKKILEPPKELPLTAIQTQAVALMRQAALGKVDPQNIIKTNKAVYDFLGGNPKTLASMIGNNRAGEAIMTRFATWWGARDLRPFQREALDTARISAAAFTQAWAPVVRATTLEARQTAFRAAQGTLGATTEVEAKVASQFRDSMEKLLHAPGLSDEAARGNTVALRAGLSMDELNDSLKATGAKFEFTNKAGFVDKYGKTHDFSNSADWLKSWTTWDVNDPVEALYKVHLALQRTTRTNSFLDDIAARYGSPVKTSEFVTKVNHPRIGEFWFPQEISQQANILIERIVSPANYVANNKMLRQYDKVLAAFKSGVTIYNPSHHVRNMIGDVWLSGLDGVMSPAPYNMAARVLHSQRGRYTGIMGVMDITDPEALARAMTRPGQTILTTKGGRQLTAEQIYTAAFNQGILMKATQVEDIMEAGGRLIPNLPVTQGRVRQVAHSTAELRDHYVRLAHFIHVLKSSKTKQIDDLFREAGHRVKRYHPDGMDMTEFERKVMRRLIPFYSWQRKSIPLVVEAMVQRPGLVTVYPKLQAEMQDAFGIEPVSGMGDPFPADQMFPEWIRAKGVGPLLSPEDPLAQLARNEPPGYVMVNPSVPFNDAAGDLADPMRFLRSSLTPVASLPLSLYSGKDPLGIPIEKSTVGPLTGAPAYAAQQAIPPLATGARITGSTRPNETFSPEQFIRWLTASGLIGTGPYKKQASFEERERLQK